MSYQLISSFIIFTAMIFFSQIKFPLLTGFILFRVFLSAQSLTFRIFPYLFSVISLNFTYQ